MISKAERKNVIQTAIELGYSKEVIKKLEKATTPSELSRIMATARVQRFGWTWCFYSSLDFVYPRLKTVRR